MINLDRNALISYLEDNSPEVAATLYSEARYPISAAKTVCIAV